MAAREPLPLDNGAAGPQKVVAPLLIGAVERRRKARERLGDGLQAAPVSNQRGRLDEIAWRAPRPLARPCR